MPRKHLRHFAVDEGHLDGVTSDERRETMRSP